jgi:hypothetical protein
MKLQAKVTQLISGSEFPDNIPRATLRIGDADQFYDTIRIANPYGWNLDQMVDMELHGPELDMTKLAGFKDMFHG